MFILLPKAAIILGCLLCSLATGRINPTQVNRTRMLSTRTPDSAQDITAATWITTSESMVIGSRPFRNLYLTPIGKFARFAVCQVTGDDSYTMYINGALVGSGNVWQASQRFYVDLSERSNLFAFQVTNGGSYAGLLAACRIIYSDGSMDTMLTDTTWHTLASQSPPNFQSPDYFENTFTWSGARSEGPYGIGPWETDVSTLPLPHIITLSASNWIWTSEYCSTLPEQTRPFRFTFHIPSTKSAEYAIILMTADNEFTLYVNGNIIGMGTAWNFASRYVVPVKFLQSIVFAVSAYNLPTSPALSPAGLIAAIQIVYSDGSTDSLVTDGTWRTITSSPPVGFHNPSFDDSAWSSATIGTPYGGGEWGTSVNVPAI